VKRLPVTESSAGAKERTTMSTCFEARTPRLASTRASLKRDRLIRRVAVPIVTMPFRSTLVKDFFWRNSEYEAEDGYFFLNRMRADLRI